MSALTETNSATDAPAATYRALCPLAVASVVAGALSILTMLHWSLAVIPLVGIALGWRARQRIRQAPDEWIGWELARLGIALSVGLWIVGYGWLIFARAKEVPDGYQRVSYDDLQPDPSLPAELIPQKALDLQDKRVFIKGFMQAGRQQTRIKDFILCPVNGECPFCTVNPRPTEKMRIVLQGDLEAMFTTHPIGVGGRFQVDASDPRRIPYTLEADYLR